MFVLTYKVHLDVFKKKHHKNEKINDVEIEVIEYDSEKDKDKVLMHDREGNPIKGEFLIKMELIDAVL